MADIRPYRPGDLEDLYRICLATGLAGQDASGIYADPKLVGHMYAAPYAVLLPECALVAEDEQGVAGYILGAADTEAFEARQESDWWPALRHAVCRSERCAAGRLDRRPAARVPDPSPAPLARRRCWSASRPTCTSTSCRACRARGWGGG